MEIRARHRARREGARSPEHQRAQSLHRHEGDRAGGDRGASRHAVAHRRPCRRRDSSSRGVGRRRLHRSRGSASFGVARRRRPVRLLALGVRLRPRPRLRARDHQGAGDDVSAAAHRLEAIAQLHRDLLAGDRQHSDRDRVRARRRVARASRAARARPTAAARIEARPADCRRRHDDGILDSRRSSSLVRVRRRVPSRSPTATMPARTAACTISDARFGAEIVTRHGMLGEVRFHRMPARLLSRRRRGARCRRRLGRRTFAARAHARRDIRRASSNAGIRAHADRVAAWAAVATARDAAAIGVIDDRRAIKRWSELQ